MTPSSGTNLHPQRGGDAALDLRSARTFLRQWLRNPMRMASITPSGRQLARLMVAQLPAGASRVAEIGAGTGVFTRALLDAGIAPAQLLVVEINPHLAAFLHDRFAAVVVTCADARGVDVLARERGLTVSSKLDAVVSGLGMLSMSGTLRTEILSAAFRALGDDGRFIQFTYGPVSPVRRQEREALGLKVRRAGFALLNLPPATVYVYERTRPPQAGVAA